MTPEQLDRFAAKCYVEPNTGCVLWTGACDSAGYGVVRSHGVNDRAHRLAYEHYRGAIPDGFVIDHLCRTPSCCNPAHLEAVTHAENVSRGLRGRLHKPTHCKRGHEFTPENRKPLAGGKSFTCRICNRMRARRSWRVTAPNGDV